MDDAKPTATAEHLCNDGQLERESWITEALTVNVKVPLQLDAELVGRLYGILGRLVNDGLQDGEEETSEEGAISLSMPSASVPGPCPVAPAGPQYQSWPAVQELFRELERLV